MARRSRIMRVVLPIAALCLLSLWGGNSAGGALIQVGNLVLVADGGFRPQHLPRHAYAPIDFKGHADIHSVNGGTPPELVEAIIDFDRDGRLQTRGLPVCSESKIAHVRTPVARRRCESSLVGTGTIAMLLFLEGGGSVRAHAPLTLFNGPRRGGNLSVLAHTHVASPVNKTFVVPVTIEPRLGEYGYRARFDVPSLAGGGVLTHVDVAIGRRYKVGGHERSYASARCSDGIFRTHGHFTFSDGTIIDGAIEKPCVPDGR
jgi:hypothetical protein